jgi:S1-C subfamily serine protease
MNHSFRRQLAVAALAAGLGGGVAAVVVATTVHSNTTTVIHDVVGAGSGVSSTATSTTSGSKTATGVNAVYRAVSPGVVEIVVTTGGSSNSPFGGSGQQSKAQGSGWVYDKLGHIVTNQHVVAGATSVHVQFADGTVHSATVVSSDPSTDVAVIKVEGVPASQLHPLTVGDSNALEVGDGVVAIGSPFGLQNTVTWGIVSALHRQMTAPSGFYENAIQTDAAVNHGNSGGPLLNMAGQVVGQNTQIESDSGGNEGVAFAVPSATIKNIVDQILTTGKAEHAFLGVKIQSVPAQVASALGLAEGAEVTSITPGTPAAKAGLQGSTSQRTFQGDAFDVGGDVITKVDGKAVTGSNDLSAAIDSYKPGDKVTLTVVHNGSTRTVTVTLGTRPTSVTNG